MAGSLYFPPRIQQQDSSGNSLSGALLYFYAPGTTTPKTVYQDPAFDDAHTNPVVADSAGRFAPIYLNGTYKVVLKDSAGSTISTDDNQRGVQGMLHDVVALSGTTIDESHRGKYLYIDSSSNDTLSLLSVTTAGAGFSFAVSNIGSANLTIDPASSTQINEATTLVIPPGGGAVITSDTTQWFAACSVPDKTALWAGTSGGTANAITLTPAPAIPWYGYKVGQRFRFLVAATNTSETVTAAVSGLTTKTIKKTIGGALTTLSVGDLLINTIAEIEYDGTQFQLVNPQSLGLSFTLADDAATSFTPPRGIKTGLVLLTVYDATVVTRCALGFFCVGATALMISISEGSAADIVTSDGTLAGTTGVDGQISIRSSSTGLVYVENRLGASANCNIQFFG